MCLMSRRYSIYLLYWYKRANIDAEGALQYPLENEVVFPPLSNIEVEGFPKVETILDVNGEESQVDIVAQHRIH